MTTNLLAVLVSVLVTNAPVERATAHYEFAPPAPPGATNVVRGHWVSDRPPGQQWLPDKRFIETAVVLRTSMETDFGTNHISIVVSNEPISRVVVEFTLQRVETWVPTGTNIVTGNKVLYRGEWIAPPGRR